MPVREWSLCLTLLAETRQRLGASWSTELDARVEGFFLATLRFMRPDGSMMFGPNGIADPTKRALRSWAEHLSEPGFKTVIDWWFPGPEVIHSPPPLPASARTEHPLASLRADWSKSGDLMAIDHRPRGAETGFEFIGLGRTWLGPHWASGVDSVAALGRAKPSLWVSNYSVDLVEWSFRVGNLRVDRTALLFRGRRLALLADQIDGKPGVGAMRVGLPDGIDVIPAAVNRSLALTVGARVVSPRLIPLGLPYRSSGGERGTFQREGNEVVLRQPIEGRRGWLPLLISWESGRNRKTLVWKPLTVSEGPKICGAETAVAYRVAWGRDESLVIYRSLARPVPRSFLGHKTAARFLIGFFTKEGNVEPILTVQA
ncbi:hypothetical protein [Singulisphaera sp. GP187]|uniref:hypothetical protein n=1 Tax=Singulisphaera sp. GP187 TaxID=1882752 RepID=UPI0020B14D75|nr:hypothetical protein [Singulisphaera sp. GP187]